MAVQETCGGADAGLSALVVFLQKAQTLYHWFEKEFGSWFCHEIISFTLMSKKKYGNGKLSVDGNDVVGWPGERPHR